MEQYLHIGGVVAVGFDSTGEYVFVNTHSGRGVFSTRTWERVARDYEVVYPVDGFGDGIGPLDKQRIPITQMNYDTGKMTVVSSHGRIVLECESSGIHVKIMGDLSE